MTEVGVVADPDYIRAEADRLGGLMKRLSAEHHRSYGIALGMDQAQLTKWPFQTHGLPVLKKNRRGRLWIHSIARQGGAEPSPGFQ
jgi:hypothetical protein